MPSDPEYPAGNAASRATNSPAASLSVETVAYRGWKDCYRLTNGKIEAIAVPAIGRVMHLGLAGEAAGVLWQNRALDGQSPDPSAADWLNFGGDKCWPAPQTEWPVHEGRAWPPPAAFDASPMRAALQGRTLTLTSPVDPGYGLQVVRRIQLDAAKPVLHIQSTYRKIHGTPVRVAVWTITQMPDPVRVYALLPEAAAFAGGFLPLMDTRPAELRVDGRLLSLKRDRAQGAKVGMEGSALLWIGERAAVRMDVETAEGDYPDGGCVTEIYTNADPLRYVELETMSPLATLRPGETLRQITHYTVGPRLHANPDDEAMRWLF